MIRIEVLSGPEAGKVVELPPGPHVLGRSPGTGVAIKGDAVSGRHLELSVAASGEVRFRDLGSTNGTWSGGVKVSEGEWFAGSELKLGNCRLRLLAEEGGAAPASGGGAAAEEAALDRRARDRALSGGRRGGPLLLVLLVVGVAGAAGGYWWLTRDTGANGGSTDPAAAAQGSAAVAAEERDVLQGLGSFSAEAAAAWTLAGGLSVDGGALRSSGGTQRASLERSLALPGCGLELAATVRGVTAWPWVEFGDSDANGEPRLVAAWAGEALGQGPVILRLPCPGLEWFRLSLLLEGAGELSGLTARGVAEGAAGGRDSERAWFSDGGNLRLARHDGRALLEVAGAGGSWQEGSGGLRFTPRSAGAWLQVKAGPVVEENGPSLILAEGGPAEIAPGVAVDASPGMLFGGEAWRLWLRFPGPLEVTAGAAGARFAPGGEVALLWDLSEALAESAGLENEMERAARQQDSRLLLQVTQELLRDWPLHEDKVQRALQLRREALQRGRQTLGELEVQVAEALFLSAVDDMQRVEALALDLAAGLPGTAVAEDATAMAAVLRESVAQISRAEEQRRAAVRARLAETLSRSYPVLAAWVEERP